LLIHRAIAAHGQLRIKLPKKKGEMTHVLAGQRITIGRRPENTIQIIDGRCRPTMPS
jgi:hypothetical protein